MDGFSIWFFILAIIAGFAAAIGERLLTAIWPRKSMT